MSIKHLKLREKHTIALTLPPRRDDALKFNGHDN